jgi:hypothetical protein
MTQDLPFDIVELVPCAAPAASTPHAALTEVAFRSDGWLPSELTALRQMFAADEPLDGIAAALGRPLHGVRSKIQELGLRRNSSRLWTEAEDALLASRYAQDATSDLAAQLGRSTAAVYARAGTLSLTEGNPPRYTAWELAQVRAGYAQGVPVNQLAVLLGRPLSGIVTIASKLGLRHRNAPPDWTEAEQLRALALAATGLQYPVIAATLAAEGFPKRPRNSVGRMLRKLGYSRGWGRPWIPEEDALLRQAYTTSASLTPLQDRLGRDRAGIAHRAKTLGLTGTHARPNGWRTDAPWTEAQLAILRRDYGRVPTPALAEQLGRKRGGVYQKAHDLGLRHGYLRPFSPEEDRAIQIAHSNGISLTDLAAALGRDVAVVSKHATRKLGIRFSERPPRAPRGRRADRPILTLSEILSQG